MLGTCGLLVTLSIYPPLAISCSFCPPLFPDGYVEIKAQIEKVYECLGMTCDDVGGLLMEGATSYVSGMEPCKSSGGEDLSAGEIAGISIVVVAVVGIIGFCLYRSRRKSKGVDHSAGDVGLGGFGNKGATSTL